METYNYRDLIEKKLYHIIRYNLEKFVNWNLESELDKVLGEEVHRVLYNLERFNLCKFDYDEPLNIVRRRVRKRTKKAKVTESKD